MMGCNNTCEKYRAIKPPLPKTRYLEGQKRCQVCDLYVWWKGIYCPCCGIRLRTTPRGYGNSREIFRDKKGIGKRY